MDVVTSECSLNFAEARTAISQSTIDVGSCAGAILLETCLLQICVSWDTVAMFPKPNTMQSAEAEKNSAWIVTQDEFLCACSDAGTTSLKIRGTKINDFSPLLGLPKLHSLEIFDFARGDLSLIGRLRSINRLVLYHIPQVYRLDPLSSLSDLAVLNLRSLPSWDASGKTLRFKTLKPLRACKGLRRLVLMKARVDEDGLMPLHKLTGLREFVTDNTFTLEDFARLAGALPDCQGDYLVPFHQAHYNPSCKKCGADKIRLSGVRRGGLVCLTCNAERVKAHIAEFERVAGRRIPHDFKFTRWP